MRAYGIGVDDPLHERLYLQSFRDLYLVVEFNDPFVALVGGNVSTESAPV